MNLSTLETVVAISASVAAIFFGYMSIVSSRNNLKIARIVAQLQEEANKISKKQFDIAQREEQQQYGSAIDLAYHRILNEGSFDTDTLTLVYNTGIFNHVSLRHSTYVVFRFWLKNNPTIFPLITSLEVPINLYGYRLIMEEEALENGNVLITCSYENNAKILRDAIEALGIGEIRNFIVNLAEVHYVTRAGQSLIQYYVNGILHDAEHYRSILREYTDPQAVEGVVTGIQFQSLEKDTQDLLSFILERGRRRLIERTEHYLRDASFMMKLVRRSHFERVSLNLEKMVEGKWPTWNSLIDT